VPVTVCVTVEGQAVSFSLLPEMPSQRLQFILLKIVRQTFFFFLLPVWRSVIWIEKKPPLSGNAHDLIAEGIKPNVVFTFVFVE
jgi:hypothetical protein